MKIKLIKLLIVILRFYIILLIYINKGDEYRLSLICVILLLAVKREN